MTANGGLQWLPAVYNLGYCVTFARGLEPAELLARMGGEPAAGTFLSLAEAESEELADREAGAVVRVGAHADWAFAVESWGAHGGRDEILRAVSARTQAVVLLKTAEALTWFTYAEDGVVVCSFDADLPHQRTGSDPDRLLPHMERVGLAPDIDDDIDTDHAILSLAEEAFGLALPRQEVEAGALLASRVRLPAG